MLVHSAAGLLQNYPNDPKELQRSRVGTMKRQYWNYLLAERVMLPDFNKSCVTSICSPETDKRLTAENGLTRDGFCLSVHEDKIYIRPRSISAGFDRDAPCV